MCDFAKDRWPEADVPAITSLVPARALQEQRVALHRNFLLPLKVTEHCGAPPKPDGGLPASTDSLRPTEAPDQRIDSHDRSGKSRRRADAQRPAWAEVVRDPPDDRRTDGGACSPLRNPVLNPILGFNTEHPHSPVRHSWNQCKSASRDFALNGSNTARCSMRSGFASSQSRAFDSTLLSPVKKTASGFFTELPLGAL